MRERYRRNTKLQILIRPFLRLTVSYHSSCKSSRVDIRALHPKLLSRDGLRRTWPAFLEANKAPSMAMARYRLRTASCLDIRGRREVSWWKPVCTLSRLLDPAGRGKEDNNTYRTRPMNMNNNILGRFRSWWVGEAGWKGDDLRGIWEQLFWKLGWCVQSQWRSQDVKTTLGIVQRGKSRFIPSNQSYWKL